MKSLIFVSALLIAATSTQGAPFTVDALSNSTTGGAALDTGVFLNAGDPFSVSVDPNDLWNAGDLPRWSNADGLTGDLFATGTDDSGHVAGTLIGQDFGLHTQHGLSLPFGTLVGELSGTFFAIGTSFSGPAPDSGILKLYYWDSFAPDNTENVLATLNVNVNTPIPEPASLILMASGLLGFAGYRWRRRKMTSV